MFIPCILNNKFFIIYLQYLSVHMFVYNKQSLSLLLLLKFKFRKFLNQLHLMLLRYLSITLPFDYCVSLLVIIFFAFDILVNAIKCNVVFLFSIFSPGCTFASLVSFVVPFICAVFCNHVIRLLSLQVIQ